MLGRRGRDGTARPGRCSPQERGHSPRSFWEGGRARLVVLATEVGGRWGVQTAQLLTALAKARGAIGSPRPGRGSMGATLERFSWRARLPEPSVSLLDRRSVSGTGEEVRSIHDVLREALVITVHCCSVFVFIWSLTESVHLAASKKKKKNVGLHDFIKVSI